MKLLEQFLMECIEVLQEEEFDPKEKKPGTKTIVEDGPPVNMNDFHKAAIGNGYFKKGESEAMHLYGHVDHPNNTLYIRKSYDSKQPSFIHSTPQGNFGGRGPGGLGKHLKNYLGGGIQNKEARPSFDSTEFQSADHKFRAGGSSTPARDYLGDVRSLSKKNRSPFNPVSKGNATIPTPSLGDISPAVKRTPELTVGRKPAGPIRPPMKTEAHILAEPASAGTKSGVEKRTGKSLKTFMSMTNHPERGVIGRDLPFKDIGRPDSRLK